MCGLFCGRLLLIANKEPNLMQKSVLIVIETFRHHRRLSVMNKLRIVIVQTLFLIPHFFVSYHNSLAQEYTPVGIWSENPKYMAPRTWGYIDSSGKWIITPRFDSASKFKEGLAKVIIDGKHFLINRKGNIVVNLPLDVKKGAYAGDISEGKFYFFSPENNKYGFMSIKGYLVAPPIYEAVTQYSE